MRGEPGHHVLTQRRRFEHQGVGPVPGDLTGQPVTRPRVDLDHVAVAAADAAPPGDGAGAAQGDRTTVGKPDPGVVPAVGAPGGIGDALVHHSA